MNIYSHSKEEIILVPVPGMWISYQSVCPPPPADKENSIQIYENFKPKKSSTTNDDLCIVPVMPAVPPYYERNEKKYGIIAPLKFSESPYSSKRSRGYRSGSRSSIIPCRKIKYKDPISPTDWVIYSDEKTDIKYVIDFEKGTILLRIKGCGMWLQNEAIQFPGFTMQPTKSMHASDDQIVSEIRGVCFENTSLTEMYATNQIEANLNKIGLVCGNHALGFWLYGEVKNDTAPLIQKTVSLFETYGDRRLEANLIVGLELLLVKKFDQEKARQILDAVLPLYENKEEKLPSCQNSTFGKIFNISTIEFWNKVQDGSFFCFDDFDFNDWSDESLKSNGLIPTIDIIKKVQKIDKTFLNFIKLFRHIGFVTGRCTSVIHRTGFVWGSFVDHNPHELHCNAHANNLIVLTKEQCLAAGSLQIVAPVDFDMSFKKENSIDFYKKPPVPDPSVVTFNIPSEFTSMISDLGGFLACTENMSTAIKSRSQPPGLLSNILWLLRDCAAYEFFKGYQKVNQIKCKENDISVDEMYQLINEGLNETIDENS